MPSRGIEEGAATYALAQVAGHDPRTFHPVALKVLPALPSVSVRSHMPGICAMRCDAAPSNVMCSYLCGTLQTC
jgi:hypothetical protein